MHAATLFKLIGKSENHITEGFTKKVFPFFYSIKIKQDEKII